MKTYSQLQHDVRSKLQWEQSIYKTHTQACGINDPIAQTKAVSAKAVKLDIEAALKRKAIANAKKIHVEVLGNDVTLTGKVPTWADREAASNSAWENPGVRKVHDHMTQAF